jgi:hypothetical protein
MSKIKAGHVIDDKVVEIKRAEPRHSSSSNGKWKNQKSQYHQLQHQTSRRNNNMGRGGGAYPRSMPYRQLQVSIGGCDIDENHNRSTTHKPPPHP